MLALLYQYYLSVLFCCFSVFRYINVFLKKVAQGGMIIYSPSRKAFYSRKQGTQTVSFKAENYTDITGEWAILYSLFCLLIYILYCKLFEVEKHHSCRTELYIICWKTFAVAWQSCVAKPYCTGALLLLNWKSFTYQSICENRKSFPPWTICNTI